MLLHPNHLIKFFNLAYVSLFLLTFILSFPPFLSILLPQMIILSYSIFYLYALSQQIWRFTLLILRIRSVLTNKPFHLQPPQERQLPYTTYVCVDKQALSFAATYFCRFFTYYSYNYYASLAEISQLHAPFAHFNSHSREGSDTQATAFCKGR